MNKYKETTANELTKAIVDYIRLTGHTADRVNNMGVYIPGKNGAKGFYRKPGTRKGLADIDATKKLEHHGRSFGQKVAIEVKIGKDKQSVYQKIVQKDIEKAGGIYIIARNFDQFLAEWEAV